MRAVVVLAMLLGACATPVRADVMPDWMAGAWLSCADGMEVSETWTGAGSGLLVGVNLTRGLTHGAGVPQFEFLRIGPGVGGAAGRLSFYGGPEGAPPTAFAMVAHAAHRVVFENPAHDFPQRVIYARDGADLTARIEGQVNGKAEHMGWRFAPAALGARCTD